MDPLVIVAGIPTALALFGVIRKNRMFFLTGYFLYALIVVPNELMTYNATGEVARVISMTVTALVKMILGIVRSLLVKAV